MNRENSGDERARPNTVSYLCEQQEKQDRCNAMPEHVHQMLCARIQAEHLAIEHVRNRSERMPVLGMHVRERPRDSVPAEPRSHVRVVVNVKRIVIVDELMMKSLAEDRPRNRDQKNSDA